MSNKVVQMMLGKMLHEHVVKPLLDGSCGLKDEELLAIGHTFCHIEKDIADTCHICNDCDPRTLTRWMDDKSVGFPRYHKGAGDKHYWWLDEVEVWKMTHHDILDRVSQKRQNKR